MTQNSARNTSDFGNGFSDNLRPLSPIDLEKCKDTDDMVRSMGSASFGARQISKAADVLYRMTTDEDCFVVFTVSGAMTAAKMGLLICDMMERGMINTIVSTGALMAHGLVESTGRLHFENNPELSDDALYSRGYNRIYDTIELEQNLDDIESIIFSILEKIPREVPISSFEIHKAIGQYLAENETGRGILKSAFSRRIPVYVPAFTDSELGLDFALFNRIMKAQNRDQVKFDPFIDLNHYAGNIKKQKKLGIFTIGGGVPRNWAQQIGPYIELMERRLTGKGLSTDTVKKFFYAARICPEPVYWGGLSGCTYSEGVSWGKFVPQNEGGMYAEVISDATIAWPVVLKAVMDRMDKEGIGRVDKKFDYDY